MELEISTEDYVGSKLWYTITPFKHVNYLYAELFWTQKKMCCKLWDFLAMD